MVSVFFYKWIVYNMRAIQNSHGTCIVQRIANELTMTCGVVLSQLRLERCCKKMSTYSWTNLCKIMGICCGMHQLA